MKDMLKITGIDLVKFVQKVYELSKPQGLGIMHFQEGGLPEEDAKDIVANGKKDTVAISMDYVKGRAYKMVVWREDGDLFIRPQWFDHTHAQLKELLADFGIDLPESSEDAA